MTNKQATFGIRLTVDTRVPHSRRTGNRFKEGIMQDAQWLQHTVIPGMVLPLPRDLSGT